MGVSPRRGRPHILLADSAHCCSLTLTHRFSSALLVTRISPGSKAGAVGTAEGEGAMGMESGRAPGVKAGNKGWRAHMWQVGGVGRAVALD